MAQRPSTPVRVPASAANHTPATLDPDLRSNINAVLLHEGHVSKIQDALLHALNANPANWPTAIQSHALALLRSGEITTFPALLRRVLDDIRHDSTASAAAAATSSSSAASASSAASSSASGSSSPSSASATNGTSAGAKPPGTNGAHGKKVNGSSSAAAAAAAGGQLSLAVPGAVVEEALRATRECLEAVCEIDDKA